MRRFFASFLAALLLVAQIQQAAALTSGQEIVVLSGIQAWSLPGSSADLYFSRNAGSCAINRLAKPCSSLLSTTRASTGYAQWADGHFTSFANNIPRITDQGILVEQTSTNKALWSNDWTNSAYTKVNVTAAMDQTGPDNVANSASSITATSNAGTILQTITEVAATNTESVYLKRITGTGTITLVQNGVSGTTCTLSTTAWTQCSVTGSVLNPALGIIMATSGDKIAVWEEQFEALTFPTSPILTTTASAARAADNITVIGAGLTALQAASVAIRAQVGPGYVAASNASARIIGINGGSQTPLFAGGSASATKVGSFNGSVEIDATLGSGTSATKFAAMASFSGAGRSIVGNGGAEVTDSNTFSAITSVNFGSLNGASNFINTPIQRLTVWGSVLTAAQRISLSNTQ